MGQSHARPGCGLRASPISLRAYRKDCVDRSLLLTTGPYRSILQALYRPFASTQPASAS